MKLVSTLILTFGFLSSAMATSLPQIGEVIKATCTSGTLDRAVVITNLQMRAEKYVTLSVVKQLVLDAQTRLAKSGHGLMESDAKLVVVLPSTAAAPYCTAKQVIPATKTQAAKEVTVAVGTVLVTIEKN